MHSNVKLSAFPQIFTVKDPKAVVAQLKLILSDPNTFSFGELIDLENVKQVSQLI